MNSRYYDPSIGRFLNADGLLGPEGIVIGHNNYAYCLNNPIKYSDETGEWVHILAAAVVGAVVASTIQVAYNVINGEEWHSNLAGAALGGAVGGALTSVGAGSIAVGFFTGTVTGVGNQFDDVCPQYDCSKFDIGNFDGGEFAKDAVTTGFLAGIGSSFGNKVVGYSNKQVGAWFKPQSLKSFVTGGFGKKVSAMILYGSIPSAVPTPANLNMKKVEEKITDLVQYYLRKRLER